MTRGVAIWTAFCGVFSVVVGVTGCAQLATTGEWAAAFVTVCFVPMMFWLLSTVGALVINVLTISGQVLEAQVTDSRAIQGQHPIPTPARPIRVKPSPAAATATPQLDFDGDPTPRHQSTPSS